MDSAGLRTWVVWLFREAVVDLRARAGLEAAPSAWRGAAVWAAADSAAVVSEEASMAAVWRRVGAIAEKVRGIAVGARHGAPLNDESGWTFCNQTPSISIS